MKKKTLADLVKVHNTLYGLSVTGAQAIFVAPCIMTLQGIINEYADTQQEDGENGEVNTDE